jgi:hypothetical protein
VGFVCGLQPSYEACAHKRPLSQLRGWRHVREVEGDIARIANVLARQTALDEREQVRRKADKQPDDAVCRSRALQRISREILDVAGVEISAPDLSIHGPQFVSKVRVEVPQLTRASMFSYHSLDGPLPQRSLIFGQWGCNVIRAMFRTRSIVTQLAETVENNMPWT